MPGKWDTSTKRLVGENPEHFIKWLLPDAQYTTTVISKPPNLNIRDTRGKMAQCRRKLSRSAKYLGIGVVFSCNVLP